MKAFWLSAVLLAPACAAHRNGAEFQAAWSFRRCMEGARGIMGTPDPFKERLCGQESEAFCKANGQPRDCGMADMWTK